MIRFLLSVAAAALTFAPISFAASPYVHDQSRTIKALSDQEMADYAAGKGMGFAKAAELNGYPGPAHVLELADDLTLSPLQRERTAALFRRMQTRASALGARLVDEERTLDELFAAKSISREALAGLKLDCDAAERNPGDASASTSRTSRDLECGTGHEIWAPSRL